MKITKQTTCIFKAEWSTEICQTREATSVSLNILKQKSHGKWQILLTHWWSAETGLTIVSGISCKFVNLQGHSVGPRAYKARSSPPPSLFHPSISIRQIKSNSRKYSPTLVFFVFTRQMRGPVTASLAATLPLLLLLLLFSAPSCRLTSAVFVDGEPR